MADKKVKISNILGSQIPDFIQGESPLFREFLEQYYASEEHEYGTTYLADNLDDLKDISKLSGVIYAAVPVVLTSEILHLDEVINVNTTEGFPETYGLIKIEDEIITYTGKTATSFTGCVRGFSGISKIESSNNPEFLTFSTTDLDDHAAGTAVQNLSLQFLGQFYKKFKYQFLPGFENRQFKDVSVENILSRAKDFYSSKGTDTALKILFNVLFGKNVEVLKPFDNTIVPSEADWSITDDIIVEAISGDPTKLIATTLFQGSTSNPTATAAISNVEEVFLGNKRYFKLLLSNDSVVNTFDVGKKTKVTSLTRTESAVTVDSTVGFPESGTFYYLDSLGEYSEATYTSKSYNQFFGCVGLTTSLAENTPIIGDQFVYGFEDFDTANVCQMRIVGSINGFGKNVERTKYFSVGDEVSVKYLGEKVDPTDKKFNNWFYNNVAYTDVDTVDPSTNTITTKVRHFLHKGDKVSILVKSTNAVVVDNVEVNDVSSNLIFQISSGTLQYGVEYTVKKNISYVKSTLNSSSVLSNIQNSFIDEERNTYVAFSGLPSYESIQTTNRAKTFTSTDINQSTDTINISQHGFFNGEKIYYQLVSGVSGIGTGYYYVNKVDNDNFKLTLSPSSIYTNSNVDLTGVGTTDQHIVTPADLVGLNLENQNNFKRIYRNPKQVKENRNIVGPIGVALNGLELYSPISKDSVFYGQLEGISALEFGTGYDINNPPELSITDDSGTGAVAHANFSGQIEEIVLETKGFNYSEVPSVNITGGNGSGAACEAKMRGYTHTVSFTDFDVDLATDSITLSTPHKFLDGEEVVYVASGTPIGIGSTNVGFSTTRLSGDNVYYIAKKSDTSFSLATTKARALAKTNLVDFNAFGNQDHTIRSKQVRTIIDRIIVKDSGSSYQNKKVTIDAQQYPPSDQRDLFSTFVGINTHDNYVYARNHDFKNGDQVVYSVDGTAISGLSTTAYYKVTVADKDRFKLSDAGTASTITSTNYDRKIFVSLGDVGVGTHTFAYPSIRVVIDGLVSIGSSTTIPSYYNATATASVKGGVSGAFIQSGGVGFGVTDIINYVRRPAIRLLTGKNANIKPVVGSDGTISSVFISNAGSEYTTPPKLEVVGSGSFARLKANISGGQIVSVDILDAGKNYKASDTSIKITPTGEGAKLNAEIHEWKFNNLKRYENVISATYRDTVQVRSEVPSRGKKLSTFYPGRFYRSLLDDNVVLTSSGYEEKTTGLAHSPIIGWAYDGNPIYGPYGNGKAIPDSSGTGGIKKIYSSYSENIVSSTGLRPPFGSGYFTQDYIYDANGDLDEYNGRYIVNLDFPNGTYAYFATLDLNDNLSYPYVTFKHRNGTDEFNYNVLVDQSDDHTNSGLYKRNVSHLGLNEASRRYPFLLDSLDSNPVLQVESVDSAKITQIDVASPGSSYKVGESLTFNQNELDCEIKEVLGKTIVSIATSDIVSDNVTFSVKDNTITGFTTVAHNFVDGDTVEISGISSSLYKDLEGFRVVGVSTINASLSVALGTTSVTGFSTFISISEPTSTKKFEKNDTIKLGSEEVLITSVDRVNNKYGVLRARNGTTGSAHTESTLVTKLSKKFTFNVNKKLENKNVDTGYSQFFSATGSVGIGTTYSSVVVGTAGSTNVTKSIPPRSIYLPYHKFNTGDELSYVSYSGTITASSSDALTPTFNLDGFDKLYCVKLNDEYIGLSTAKVGFTTNYVYFTDVTGDSHSFEVIKTNLTGSAKKVSATVTLDTQHSLAVGDGVRLNVKPSRTQNFDFRFNDSIKKLVVNPVSFASTAIGVGTTNSSITLSDHDFNTGDIVVYVNSVGIATPLQNNGVYYVIKESDDAIKLAETEYDALSFPYNHIGITTYGSGTHEISKINPKLEFYRGNNVSIAVSDVSLVDYDVNFYTDNQFKTRYESGSIIKKGTFGDLNPSTEISISVSDALPESLFYRVEGDDLNYTNTFPSSANTDVDNYSSIDILSSKFNKLHTVTGIGSTTFDFTLVGSAETNSYASSGFSSAIYSTNSSTETGGIYSVRISNFGKPVKDLPQLTSIGSTTGSNALISVRSNSIGRIIDSDITNQGLEFTEDKTLAPKADSSLILNLRNVFTLKSVGVTTGGRNYTGAPTVVAIGNSSILTDTTIQGNSVFSVEVLSSDSNLSEDLRVIPTNNSNGVGIINATSTFATNTLFLRAPITGFTEFPFAVSDQIYVENVKITNSADGYNSSDYGYRNFTVTGINTVSGSESITYSIAGIGSTGGSYDPTSTFGRVIKSDNLAVLQPEFEKVKFFEGEKITSEDGSATGVVAKNGWNPEAQTLKLTNVIGEFEKEDIIIGATNNFKSTVSDIFSFDFDLSVGSLVENESTWKTDTGKLNSDLQRIHDSNYYQRFSYSVRGEVPYQNWSEPVNSLTHVSGYKNFADLEIINGIGNTVGMSITDTQIDLNVEVNSLASVHSISHYDLVSEDTTDSSLSKIVKFDSKVITDYNESRTNKVLLIDDISPQFTGFVTSTGGGIVGLSTFALFTGGDTLFYHTFDPTGIDTSTSTITIPRHNFNTGEQLVYSPTNNDLNSGSSIGIVTTSSLGIGIGTTSILPGTVYAIRVTEDKLQLAIGASEATAGTAVTFTTLTGIGLTHSLEVDSDLANTRTIITLDNIIQSPIARKDVSVSLSSAVGIGSTVVFLNDVSNVVGKSLLKIEDEIIRVELVGVGATNSLDVIRGQMGTVAAAHTVGAAVTVLSGDYRIYHGNIYFTESPYGPAGIGTLTTRTSFSGRAFYRLNYDTNLIIDDISESFDGATDKFNLTSNSQAISGIQSSFGAILINNIFQRPFYGDVGSILESDYQIVGTGQTIDFTGTGVEDLPKGGIINEFDVGIGSGYQVPRRALATAVVSAGGTIQSIGLSTGGSGYIGVPRVSIADTLGVGVGASVIASVTAGLVTSFTIAVAGSGYTSTNPPLVVIDEPKPYKNIPLSGGQGSGAKMDVVVGTGGSVVSFDISDRGLGYEIGDVLTLTQLPFQVGIGTSNFEITVRNRYQNKFSGWTFGQLLELDDFSDLFNGFRKSFLLTRTIVNKEYYSIVAQSGSGIILANNLMIFLNDVLQKPGQDYTFSSGTRLTFREAPRPGSKLKVYFYVGSSSDFIEVDVDETIKPGDRLTLQSQDSVPQQGERIIYELIASDTVETQNYSGVGIVTDTAFTRPTIWTKQTSDLIIDGEKVSKERDYLEPQIYPNTNIIASVGSTDTKMYVKDPYLFSRIDDLGQTLNDIIIVGLGTTAVTEVIKTVTYQGDYGLVIGIGTSATGINTTSPMLEIDLIPHPNIYSSSPNNSQVSKPGISTGDYFVLENTILGSGVTSIVDDVSNVVAIGNSFIDNVYYASKVTSIGSSSIRVSVNVDSLNGINTSTLPTDLERFGNYTWGSIDISSRSTTDSRAFEFYNQNGLVGIETSAHVSRILQMRLAY